MKKIPTSDIGARLMKAAFAETGKKPRNCKYRRFLPKLMIHDYEALMEYGRKIRSVINVDTIRIWYPIVKIEDDYYDFKIGDGTPATTMIDLLIEINRLLDREDAAGHNYAPHDLEDYRIGIVDIHGHIADVIIDS